MSIEFMSASGKQVLGAIQQTIKDCHTWQTRPDGTRVRVIDKAASDRIAALALKDGRVDWDEDLLIRAFVVSSNVTFADASALSDALPNPYAEPSVAESAYLRQLLETQHALQKFQLSYDIQSAATAARSSKLSAGEVASTLTQLHSFERDAKRLGLGGTLATTIARYEALAK
jgi:hypothetical protein